MYNADEKELIRARICKYSALIILFVVFLILMFVRDPFFDEAHAWMVSKSFSFLELFAIEKFEGHLFIWHSLLMPFSKNNFLYPYSMYFLNFIFCFSALIIIWQKAPFHYIYKFLITLSFPFLCYFAPVARCYSIGILFLFLILSLWKNRFNHPYIVSILLVGLANTSAMAIIGAVPLGILFVFDLIKEKKILPFLILIFGAVLVSIQLFGAYHPDISVFVNERLFLYKFLLFFSLSDIQFTYSYWIEKLIAFSTMAVYFCSIFYFAKQKRVLFFHLLTVFLMFALFIFKYPGAWWHYLFFFVYLISSIWLFEIEGNNSSNKIKKIFNVLFSTLLVSLFLMNFYFPFYNEVYNSTTSKIAKKIKEIGLDDVTKIKLYALDSFSQTSNGVLPYFKDLKLYNVNGGLKYSKEEYKSYMTSYDKKLKIDRMAESLDEKKINIGISDRMMHSFYEGDKWVVIPHLISDYNNFKVYGLHKARK